MNRINIHKSLASAENLSRPCDFGVALESSKPSRTPNQFSVKGGGSGSSLSHLPPPDKSSSASSSPTPLRRLSAASVASRASQNRLSGGSFKGSRSKITVFERKKNI